MGTETGTLVQTIISILFFPTIFQKEFVLFAWGAGDATGVMVAKRILLLLPVFAVIIGCWISMASVLTVVIRQKRRDFIMALILTWWDLGKAIVAFWGGVIKFLMNLMMALVGLVKIIIIGIWSLFQEIIFMPFRLLRNFSKTIVSSRIPWIAVILTVFWCLIEGTIFTYVMTPIVVDTFSNITGEQLVEGFVRIPLFIFLLFIILGSYATLSTFVDSFKQKNISSIIGIGVIELVVLFVEVVFLYREFVDSLVPWFAQYSENFELGVFWTLAISCFVWFGIRSLSWFLFASHGTPTIMNVIQGKGLQQVDSSKDKTEEIIVGTSSKFISKLKEDTNWIQEKGEELLESFMLPPLQVIAAAINFFTLLIANYHLFEFPFKSIEDITKSKDILDNISKSQEVRSEIRQKA
jgi:hypothetical protein